MFFQFAEEANPLWPLGLSVALIFGVGIMSLGLEGRLDFSLGEVSVGIDVFLLLGDYKILLILILGEFLLPVLDFLDGEKGTISMRLSSALFSRRLSLAMTSCWSFSILGSLRWYSIMLKAERSWSMVTWLLRVANCIWEDGLWSRGH